jgi:2-methylcitrate dehydratase PrpD
VCREGIRSILTFVGCTIAGARHEAVEIALAALLPFSAGRQATLLGRTERLDVMNAALINGISSIVLDYDATQFKKTNIHPSGPVLPPLIGLAETRTVSGAELLHAYLLGVEVECRLANVLFGTGGNPGWHVTGAVGPMGAAAAAGRLLGLTSKQMHYAFGIAATQPGGLREMYGTMCKSFTPGRAAQNGLLAAILAAQGFDSAEAPLEGEKGFAQVLMQRAAPQELVAHLGEEFEISSNTYKPFACAIVCHAAIDACQRLLREHRFLSAGIRRIALQVPPVTLELAGNPEPQTGLASKFSVHHAVALALTYGDVSHHHFTDALASDAKLVGLRRKVEATAEPAFNKSQARLTIHLDDDRILSCFVEHALGSLENPMSDEDLSRKFHQLVDGILPPAQANRLAELCWDLPKLADASVLVKATSTGA